MAETFKWNVERQNLSTTVNYRTINIVFGDGYEQISSDGINNKQDSYNITVHAHNQDVIDIIDFFDRHAGRKAFFWTPPLGKLGLFTCADASPTPQGGGLYTISGTFRRAYQG